MLTTSEHTQPSSVLPTTSTATISNVPVDESLSPEDKMILYAALQEIANELRRIKRERKKNQAKRNQ